MAAANDDVRMHRRLVVAVHGLVVSIALFNAAALDAQALKVDGGAMGHGAFAVRVAHGGYQTGAVGVVRDIGKTQPLDLASLFSPVDEPVTKRRAHSGVHPFGDSHMKSGVRENRDRVHGRSGAASLSAVSLSAVRAKVRQVRCLQRRRKHRWCPDCGRRQRIVLR